MNGKARLLDGKGNLVGTRNQTKGNLFDLDLSSSSCFLAHIEKIWLWHKRMCHVNFDNMVIIRKKIRVRGIPTLKKPKMAICKKCQIGKMGKTNFKSKNYKNKEVLELVHTDLCGTISTESYTRDNFFIFFVDDYSRMMRVMYLNNKFESFQKFKWYLARAEKEIGKKLKCLRSDRGGEFISNKFNEF